MLAFRSGKREKAECAEDKRYIIIFQFISIIIYEEHFTCMKANIRLNMQGDEAGFLFNIYEHSSRGNKSSIFERGISCLPHLVSCSTLCTTLTRAFRDHKKILTFDSGVVLCSDPHDALQGIVPIPVNEDCLIDTPYSNCYL